MSMRSKKRAKERRRKARAEAKAARIALYKGYAAAGRSKRRDRRRHAGAARSRDRLHRFVPCGNPGCVRCYPKLAPRVGWAT